MAGCAVISVPQVPPGGTSLLGAEHRGPPGAAQEAASPVELGEKRIKTVRQNWLLHLDTCTQIYNFPPYIMFFAQSKEQAA